MTDFKFGEWYDISSAPPGQRVLVRDNITNQLYVAELMFPMDGGDPKWIYCRMQCEDGSLDCAFVSEPTHWMSLPACSIGNKEGANGE